jgi:hypothetical protein
MAVISEEERIFRMPQRGRRERRVVIAWIIPLLLSLWLLWQTVNYRGLIALAAEWQFNIFGRYYPTLTFLLLALIVFSPLIIWSAVMRRRRSKSEDAADLDPVARRQRGALAVLRLLIAAAIAVGVIGLIALLSLAALPSSSGTVQQVSAGGLGQTLPREGPTALTGTVVFDRTTAFDEDLWFVGRSVRFAPMIGRAEDGRRLRFFVELPANERNDNPPQFMTRRGILQRGGLPGEVLRLYRYVGYQVDEPYYVLFASRASMRWPHLMVAGESALAALLILIAAVLVRARRPKRAPTPASQQVVEHG